MKKKTSASFHETSAPLSIVRTCDLPFFQIRQLRLKKKLYFCSPKSDLNLYWNEVEIRSWIKKNSFYTYIYLFIFLRLFLSKNFFFLLYLFSKTQMTANRISKINILICFHLTRSNKSCSAILSTRLLFRNPKSFDGRLLMRKRLPNLS